MRYLETVFVLFCCMCAFLLPIGIIAGAMSVGLSPVASVLLGLVAVPFCIAAPLHTGGL